MLQQKQQQKRDVTSLGLDDVGTYLPCLAIWSTVDVLEIRKRHTDNAWKQPPESGGESAIIGHVSRVDRPREVSLTDSRGFYEGEKRKPRRTSSSLALPQISDMRYLHATHRSQASHCSSATKRSNGGAVPRPAPRQQLERQAKKED